MAITNVIYSILRGYTPLTDYTGDRIFPLRIDHGTTFPAISYHLVSTTPSNTKDMISTLDFARVQVSVFAQDGGGVSGFERANEIADKVRDAIEASGAGLPSEIATYKVNQLWYDGQVQLSDDEAGFAGVVQVAVDFIVGYNR